jgi:hypothetical protein
VTWLGRAGGIARGAAPVRLRVRLRGGSALPARYYRFTHSTGFSIGVPGRLADLACRPLCLHPRSGEQRHFLLIDQSDQQEPNALADWRQQAASAVPPR